jgi:multisubunit Na+/H+ antiporter MnhG subunit
VSVVVVVLLVLVGASATLSTLGVLTARDAADGLHYLGPAAQLGGTALVLAVLAAEGPGEIALRTLVVVLVLQLSAAVTTHATGRAGDARLELTGDGDRVVEP